MAYAGHEHWNTLAELMARRRLVTGARNETAIWKLASFIIRAHRAPGLMFSRILVATMAQSNEGNTLALVSLVFSISPDQKLPEQRPQQL